MAKNDERPYGLKNAVQGQAPFAVVEAYKAIRTNVLYALAQNKGKIVTVSSSLPGEGKSTCAVNLSAAFSQLGSRVLLIDADLRKPTVNKKLKIKNSSGLSSVLVGFCAFKDAVQHINQYFDVLASGPIPPNPAELLGSDNMRGLLDSLYNDYDYIIIDTPPINVVTDAILISHKSSGLILVVKSDSTTHEEFEKAVESIEFSDVKLLGVVINGGKKYSGKYEKYKRYQS